MRAKPRFSLSKGFFLIVMKRNLSVYLIIQTLIAAIAIAV